MAALDVQHTIVVVTGGDPLPGSARDRVPEGATVIAADSGIVRAEALGLGVDVAVGDFDSVTPATLDRLEASGTTIERHPAAKDATDLELALTAAVDRGGERVLVLGGHGGRLDHLLANAALLASPLVAHVEVVAYMGEATVTVVRSHASIAGAPGELVSLLPVHGPATGVVTAGLLYPLRRETLHPGSSRGVSNEMVDLVASVELEDGVLLVVQPGALVSPTGKEAPR